MVVYYILKYITYLHTLTPYCFRILYTCIMYLVSIAKQTRLSWWDRSRTGDGRPVQLNHEEFHFCWAYAKKIFFCFT